MFFLSSAHAENPPATWELQPPTTTVIEQRELLGWPFLSHGHCANQEPFPTRSSTQAKSLEDRFAGMSRLPPEMTLPVD